MVTRTSGSQAILQCNCIHEAASTAEGTHSLPGAGPGEVAGAFVQCCPAAVEQPPQSTYLHTGSSEALVTSLPWIPVQVH